MQLGHIFTPKHQKLVNQCYPSGRAPDKKPKSSETSYLIYYVNSRSSKLEKVSNYLIKRTNTDLSRRRVGNVCVTLELMAKIVDHCKENLNVFVKEFLTLMNMVLTNNSINNDVTVIELLEITFGTICRNLDGAYYGGDTEFIKMFKSFVDLLFEVVSKRLNNDDLMLKVCIDISTIIGIASDPQLNYLVPKCVETAIDQLQARYPQFKENSLLEQPSLTKRLSKTQTRAQEVLEIPTEDNDLCVATLHNYFNTTETDKLNLSIRSLIKKLQSTPNKELLEFISNDIPVQLRYIVVLLLTRQVSNYERNQVSGNQGNPDGALNSLKLISCLLVSKISIVGLSVLDIMRKVLAVQLKSKESMPLVHQCRVTIKDLNNKIYYSEQTSDMLYDLVVKIKNVQNEVEKRILVDDIKYIVDDISQPVINVDLLTELVPFMKGSVIQLLNITEEHISGGSTLSRLFQMVRDIEDRNLQSKAMSIIFDKYKKIILLPGLNYFQMNIKEPEYTYYLYHFNAAKTLGVTSYYSETQQKLDSGELFTKEELMKYYKNANNTQFGEKGMQILMSYDNQISNSDLLNDRPLSPVFSSKPLSSPMGLISPQAQTNTQLNQPMRFVSDDVHSWKVSRPSIPKVSDLKKAMKNGSSTKNKPLRGSQSVKSRVTNITFLLSELRSTTAGDDSHIIDPDEEEVVGIDKMEIARSLSGRGRNSAVVEDVSTNRASFVPATVNEDDEFRDAVEDVEAYSTSRGKIFANY